MSYVLYHEFLQIYWRSVTWVLGKFDDHPMFRPLPSATVWLPVRPPLPGSGWIYIFLCCDILSNINLTWSLAVCYRNDRGVKKELETCFLKEESCFALTS